MSNARNISKAESRFVNASGDTMSGKLLTAPSYEPLDSLSDNTIGFAETSHPSGWGVNEAVMARTGDVIWAIGSNGGTGANNTLFLGVGSQSGGTFGTAMSFNQDRTAVQVPNKLIVGRTIYNWHNYGGNPAGVFWHIKTNLLNNGSNPQPTMSLFHAIGYNYDGQTIDTKVGFHNWSGGYHGVVLTNNGSRAAGASPYVSTDGYVVVVFNIGTSYPGVQVNYSQLYPYSFLNVQVTAQSFSGSSTGEF